MADVCNDLDFLKSFRVALVIIQIIRILVPIVLMYVIIKNIWKSSFSKDSPKYNDTMTRIGKRFLAAMIVFLAPSLIQGVIYVLSNQKNNFYSCIENATEERMVELTYITAKNAVDEAKDKLNLDSYMKAEGYVHRVENENDRARLETILEDIKTVLAIKGLYTLKIEAKIDKKDLVSKIKDTGLKEDANSYLDAQDDVNGTKSSFNNQDEEAITPSSSDNVIRKAETSTLKVYIIKKGSTYITKIWAADPYKQLNKFDSPQYGKNLYRPKVLLEKAMNSKNLGNKLLIGFNASGFYLANVYDKASVSKYPAYDKTSVGTLVITDGKVVRNAYSKAYKTWFTAGVNPNGELLVFTDAKESNSSTKKKWADTVINSKIRNTFTFASILVKDGKKSNVTTSMPSVNSAKKRQAICQVNKNNFVLITGTSLNREKLITLMLNEKCTIGTNFDGGGSIALLYKAPNSSKIEAILGNGRALTEVGYFSEQ